MKRRKKIYILLILTVLWSIIIFIGCTMPPALIPKWNIPHFDKVAHFGFFFVQSVLISLLFYYQTGKSFLLLIFISTFWAFVYGGTIELLQGAFFNRTADVYDLCADILGGLFGAMVYPLILQMVPKK